MKNTIIEIKSTLERINCRLNDTEEQISKLEFMSADYMTAPTDARIEIEDDNYEIIPETMGTTTIPDEVLAYQEPVDINELVSDVTLAKLNDIFQSIMKKQVEKIDPVRSKFGKIQKEEISLEDKMSQLTEYASVHKHFSFRILLEEQSSKVDIIVTFLAILELMKMGKIIISQEKIFDDIKIDSKIAA